MRRAAAVLGAALLAFLAPSADAAERPRGPEPAPERSEGPEAGPHGRPDGLSWGAYGELRLAEDRVRGASDPEWFSFGRVGAFATAQIDPRIRLDGEVAWDRGSEDFSLERAEVALRVRGSVEAHAGVLLVPLGRTNLAHEATGNEFDEWSLVATQLIGVPLSQRGIGLRSEGGAGRRTRILCEADVVTGYSAGLILDSPGGTRLPRGRNNAGDDNGLPALVGRIAFRPSEGTEFGLAAQSGPYNRTEIGGVRVDRTRYVHVVVVDGASRASGIDLSGEAALALIDVPDGLRPLYAGRQWGASIEAARAIARPVFRRSPGSSLGVALRVDAVDFDRALKGDSRHRASASLSLRPRAGSVARVGWYYELQRDRFNNDTPKAGLTLSAASRF